MEPMQPKPHEADHLASLTKELENIKAEIIKFYFSQDQKSDAYREKIDIIIKGLKSCRGHKREQLNQRLEAVGLSGPLLKDKITVWKKLLQEGKSLIAAFVGSSFCQSIINVGRDLIPDEVLMALDFLSEFFVNNGGRTELETETLPPPKFDWTHTAMKYLKNIAKGNLNEVTPPMKVS